MQSFHGTMRNLLCYAGSVVTAFLIGGCVQVEQVLSLHADGSGELDVTYGMSLEDIERMQAMSKEAFAGEGAETEADAATLFDFNEDDIRADFKAYEQHGVTLRSVRTDTSNGWKFVHLEIEFKTLEGLSRTEFISDRTLSLTRNEQGHYTFRQAAAQPAGENGSEGLASEQDAVADAMAEMMKGFRAVMKVRTPSKVLSTNAGIFDEESATWEFDLEKDPQALKRAQQLDLQVQFDGAGLTLPEFKPAGGG